MKVRVVGKIKKLLYIQELFVFEGRGFLPVFIDNAQHIRNVDA